MKCPKCNSERAIGSGGMNDIKSYEGLSCPDCGYEYNSETMLPKFCMDDNIMGICGGSIIPQEKCTLRIDKCEHIYLTQKSIDIEVNVHIPDFDKFEEIIINGKRFVRSREDERIST